MSQEQSIAVFVYNFPHKKSQDFLLRLIIEGLFPKIVLAADPIKLSIPKPLIRVKPLHVDLIHPKIICNRFDIEYKVIDHNCEECCNYLRSRKIELGIIAGARILRKPVIESVVHGIINIHPGLLPEGRGYDALQWAIFEGRELGVTSHVINHRIDHGYIIKRVVIPEYPDDTFIDLSLRLEQTQTNILAESIYTLNSSSLGDLEPVRDGFSLHKKMPAELERLLPNILEKRLTRLLQ